MKKIIYATPTSNSIVWQIVFICIPVSQFLGMMLDICTGTDTNTGTEYRKNGKREGVSRKNGKSPKIDICYPINIKTLYIFIYGSSFTVRNLRNLLYLYNLVLEQNPNKKLT